MAKKKKKKAGSSGAKPGGKPAARSPDSATGNSAGGDTSQADLVAALESIKGLLEQGEEKLTIARESIQRANDSSHPQKIPVLNNSDEEIVPVLDDIVDPDELDMDIPVLDESSTETEAKSTSPTRPASKPATKNKAATKSTKNKTSAKKSTVKTEKTMKTVLDDELIDNIQKELEQVIRERLMKSMIRLENELKVEIRNHLDKLRNER